MFSSLLSLLLPPRCLSCHCFVDRQGTLCAPCWRGLEFFMPPWCARCGTPIAQQSTMGVSLHCAACSASPPEFSKARSVIHYNAHSAGLLTRLKFHDHLYGAPHFADWMCRAGEEVLRDANLLVPVPLHRTRFLMRRYNQSALLAREISKRTTIPMRPEVLARIRSTQPQTGLSRSARLRNVQGAFRVPLAGLPLLYNQRVVLVDDVMTTGATINAAVRALQKGGAKDVRVLTLARRVRG